MDLIGSCIESAAVSIEPVPVGDAGTAGVFLTHCTAMWTPHLRLLLIPPLGFSGSLSPGERLLGQPAAEPVGLMEGHRP